VSLKLSKAAAVLPSGRAVAAANTSKRISATKNSRRIRAVLQGPLTTSGKFFSQPEGHPPVGCRLPTKSELTRQDPSVKGPTNRKGNGKPVSLKVSPLSSGDRRKLSKNPSGAFKRSLPSGPYEVWPVRRDVQVFQRRAWACHLAFQALSLAGENESRLIDTISSVRRLIWEIFPGESLRECRSKYLSTVCYLHRKQNKLDSVHEGKLYKSDTAITNW